MEWIALILILVAVLCYGANRAKRSNGGLRVRSFEGETPQEKGYRGEFYVRQVVGDTVPGEKYVINDLVFRHGDKTCQVDHVVINKNGVYVIETKNYSGTVYGSDSQRYWTQYVGSKKHTVYNPVKQNAAHIGYIQRRLGRKLYMVNLVVFVQNNIENIQSDAAIPLSVLDRRLALPSKIKPYTAEQMEQIYREILALRDEDLNGELHAAGVIETRENVKCGICPRCGRTLVTRQGKYGTFLGCAGYPECDFIKRGR